MSEGLLHQRAVLLAKVETEYNTDSEPTSVDAILVEDPDYTVDANVLERNFARNDLSPLAHKIGRKLAGMAFMVEAGTNGAANTGTQAQNLGSLFRACGMSQTAIQTTSAGITPVRAHPGTSKDISWELGGDDTFAEPVVFDIIVTTSGPSGTARVTITPDANAVGEGDGGLTVLENVAITSGAALSLQAGGFTVTPTFEGDLTEGQCWQTIVYPTGFLYQPVSESFESCTMYLYFDGILHKMTGGRGSVSFEATAGEYGKFSFTFTGQYIAPVDAPMPTTPLYDQKDPPIFEQAQLLIGKFPACVNSLSWDLGVQVSPRPCANSSDGYEGVRIAGRAPAGGIDPEATLVEDEDFWGRMSNSTQMLLRARIGQVAGRKITFIMPGVQYTGLSYQERENLRSFDAGITPKRLAGNDELFIHMG